MRQDCISSFTNITRDGINIQDNHIRQNASSFSVERPSVDDVGEFTLTTQNAGSDLGYGASQVQFVTSRGQNAYHGGLFYYNRNSEFSANSFFNNASGTPKSFLNRNQFGGNLSGPIIKNKLFFFGFYEGLRLRTQSSQLRTILTPSARQGIFTFTNNAGVRQSVNIFSLLPASAGLTGIDPIVQSRILNNLPAAGNTTERGDGLNATGLRFLQRANNDRDKYSARFDYDLGDHHTINGVYSYTDERLTDRPDVDSPSGFGAVPVFNQPATRQFLALAYRWSPTARFTQTCQGTGRAAEGFGSTPFNGQVFFNNGPGETGALERAFINGPFTVGWDASIIKNIQVTETRRLQLRVEAFNLLNRANFGVSGAQQFGAGGVFDINSSNFGRLTGTFAPRIVQLVGRFEF